MPLVLLVESRRSLWHPNHQNLTGYGQVLRRALYAAFLRQWCDRQAESIARGLVVFGAEVSMNTLLRPLRFWQTSLTNHSTKILFNTK